MPWRDEGFGGSVMAGSENDQTKKSILTDAIHDRETFGSSRPSGVSRGVSRECLGVSRGV